MQDLSDLRQSLIDMWAAVEKSIIDNAIDQCCKHLRACIRARGEPYAYSLLT